VIVHAIEITAAVIGLVVLTAFGSVAAFAAFEAVIERVQRWRDSR
jgi:hypothetical protein